MGSFRFSYPMCISWLGDNWIDPGTLPRTSSPVPGVTNGGVLPQNQLSQTSQDKPVVVLNSNELNQKLYVKDIITGSHSVIDTFNGVDAMVDTNTLNNTNSNFYFSDYQCAEYVKRYFKANKKLPSVHNLSRGKTIFADDKLYDQNGNQNNKGPYHKALKSAANPSVGDLANYKNGEHFAIVKAVSGINVTLIEQNWTYTDPKSGKVSVVKNRVALAANFSFYNGNEFEFVIS